MNNDIKYKFRIKEINYENKQTLFFCQELKKPFIFSFTSTRKWIDIMNTAGYETFDTAKKDLKSYINFYKEKEKNKISYYYLNNEWIDEINNNNIK